MAQHTLSQREYAVPLNLAIGIILALAGITCSLLIWQHHLNQQRQQQSLPHLTYSIEH